MKINNYKLIKPAFSIFVVLWLFGIFVDWTVPHIEGLIYLDLIAGKTYSLVCHQDPDKLITSGIYSSKVCARCAGIYSGAVISIAMLLFVKLKKAISIKYLLISSLPIMIDIIFYNIGIYPYSKSIAYGTGILFGSTGFFYITAGIDKIIYELESTKI
jgi:uncharacterized membrane protein